MTPRLSHTLSNSSGVVGPWAPRNARSTVAAGSAVSGSQAALTKVTRLPCGGPKHRTFHQASGLRRVPQPDPSTSARWPEPVRSTISAVSSSRVRAAPPDSAPAAAAAMASRSAGVAPNVFCQLARSQLRWAPDTVR